MSDSIKTAMALCALFAGTALVYASEPPPAHEMSVSAASLRIGREIIIGELGLPLGTPVQVEGYLLPPQKSAYFAFPVEITLAIDTIAGEKIDAPRKFSFRVESPVASKLDNTESELKKVFDFFVQEHDLSREQADKMFGDYAKVRRKLLVYESAYFIGRPRNLPPAAPRIATPPFGFETFIVVVASE